jgi:hypothetical protein
VEVQRQASTHGIRAHIEAMKAFVETTGVPVQVKSHPTTGMRRIYEYCYPLEDARARRAYGVPSGVNNILIINKVITADRVTAIIVSERLGF